MRYASAPVSTHRLQLEPDFTLDDAVAQVKHLATLGITHVYLSPILQATFGSKHGYDVTDHTDRKSTRQNSSHQVQSRMPSSA